LPQSNDHAAETGFPNQTGVGKSSGLSVADTRLITSPGTEL
jgi:hypothetical protein